MTKEKFKSTAKTIFNILFRIIGLIPFAIFMAIALLRQYILTLIDFLAYGGEFVKYKMKYEKHMINDIYSLLKSNYQTSQSEIEVLKSSVKITDGQLYDTLDLAGKQYSFIIKNGLQKEWDEFKNMPEDEKCEGK